MSVTYRLKAWWLQPLAECQAELKADQNGLSSNEAISRLARFGPNRFRDQPQQLLLIQLLNRFKNPLVVILLAASAISALSGEVGRFCYHQSHRITERHARFRAGIPCRASR